MSLGLQEEETSKMALRTQGLLSCRRSAHVFGLVPQPVRHYTKHIGVVSLERSGWLEAQCCAAS
jgi:hypothetical protein